MTCGFDMIGGVDVILQTPANPRQAVSASLRLAKRIWPSAVVENADTGQRSAIGVGAFLPEEVTEMFIYQNEETACKWDELGAETQLANTMIHILVQAGQITLVVDDPNAQPIQAFISGLSSALRMDIFSTRAIKGAAA